MKTEVLIIGGGVAGCALANLLGKVSLNVCLAEARALPQYANQAQHSGRTAALMGASINILKTLDVWDELEPRTTSLKTMRIIDDSDPSIDPVQIDFPASEIDLESFGQNIPNMMLHGLLAEKAEENKNVTILTGNKLENYESGASNNLATLDNGQTIEAKIIIGADGRHSKVRQIADINTKENNYDQTAITCLITHTKPHDNISTEHHRAGGPFTIVPMPDKDGQPCSSIVWIERTSDATRYIALDKYAFEQALQQRTRSALGTVTLASNPESWPLTGIIADKITAPRVALIAEAAHVMSPIGAQGLNLSLRDVATLAEILIDAARLGEDIGNELVLARYAKARRIDMQTRFFGVDSYNRLVSNNIGFLRGLRRTGLKALQNIPAFKHLAMQEGLAPTQHDSRLMRGEAL